MSHLKKILFLTILPLLLGTSTAWCNVPVEVQLANMQEDMAILQRDLGRMRLELEAMQQENESLRAQMTKVESSQARQLEGQLAPFKSEIVSQNQKQKQEIISLVAIQVERLAKQTQSAIDALSKSLPKGGTKNGVMSQFSDDYPKNGFVYVVQNGDTLGEIAKKNNALVKDIQNANRIANPSRDLRAGDSIFIPQKT